MVPLDVIWATWQATAQDAGYRVPLTPHGGNVRLHLQAIASMVDTDAELRQAMQAWWGMRLDPQKRNLGMFTAMLTGVLHTMQAHQAWCAHAPECQTQAEHLRRTLDEERARQGIAPRVIAQALQQTDEGAA